MTAPRFNRFLVTYRKRLFRATALREAIWTTYTGLRLTAEPLTVREAWRAEQSAFPGFDLFPVGILPAPWNPQEVTA